ncbi:hypothetical protein [Macrococcus capreoli]|uniref:hypothetical protein n=1 Tax=Macrococcus capreoli TaxID=2982690 RepID=UPI003F434D8B
MKNVLFWVYVLVAIIIIALGYNFWENRVTGANPEEKNISTQQSDEKSKEKKETSDTKSETKDEANENLFKNKTFQKVYTDAVKDKEQMNITIVNTPYQTSNNNSSVKDELEKNIDKKIKLNELEVANESSTIDFDKINKTKPDLIILDALTLNDYFGNVSVDEHNAAIEKLYKDAKKNKTQIIIVGTRPEYDDADFKTYQQAESKYFSNENNDFYYVDQADQWPNDKSIEKYYDIKDGLLTYKGVEQWVQSINKYLFK